MFREDGEMMQKRDYINIKTVGVALLFFLGMLFLINGSFIGTAKLMEVTGGQNILDMEFEGYSVEKAYTILDALGEEGRAFNMKYIIPLDIIFPLSYGLFYFMALSLIAKHLFTKMKRFWLIGLVGFVGTLFDLAENIAVFRLLQNYPLKLPKTVEVASLFTQIKGTFTFINMVLIALGLFALIVCSIRRHTRQKGY